MNNEDKKMQKQLVDEMMKVSKTNPDVMIYMQSLMKCYEDLEKELDQYKNNWEELKKWISTEARIELYGDGKGFRTFLDEKDVLNKMKELEEDK